MCDKDKLSMLNLLTWNVTGIMSSAACLCDVITGGDIDICGISEHWLCPHNLHFLDSISGMYNYHAVCDNDLTKRPHQRQIGKGGVAILWNRKYDNYIVPLSIDSDFVVGIQLQLSPQYYVYIFQVYLPCTNHSVQTYIDCITFLYDLYYQYSDQGLTVFLGDFNARANRVDVSRDRYLTNFIVDCNLCAINCLPMCHGPGNTFVTYDDLYTSMIDYVLLPIECTDLVVHCEIADDHCLNVSRHRPILCSISCHTLSSESQIRKSSTNWKRVNHDHIDMYQNLVSIDQELNNYAHNSLNVKDIDDAYEIMCEKLIKYSDSVFPRKKYKPHLKPFWSTELDLLHVNMKRKREIWCKAGRPRESDAIERQQYKSAKSEFRRIHRQYMNQYMRKLDHELEHEAERDSVNFWKSLNARKSSKRTAASSGIVFNGEVCRNKEKLTENWGIYFKQLYSHSEAPFFDQTWKSLIESRVEETLSSIQPDNTASVSVDFVEKAIKELPKGKAGSGDDIVYEHLIYAKRQISPLLANLYTYMLRHAYIPDTMKQGVIITLHKGGKKRKDDPNNYRAITLSSAILKLYETVLLERCQDTLLGQISVQQGGFQQGLGCLMSSFVLRECIYHSLEQSAKVYLCFLDSKQAFDHVWHDGLIYKLIENNIDATTLLSIRELYRNSKCRVRYQGILSQEFPVLQGTRQGGKSSPLLYLVFINGLIEEIEASGYGYCMYNMAISSPTVADDMVLVSFSKSGLDEMIELCWNYSRKWRYFYNAAKCKVVVCNDKHAAINAREFKIGSEIIEESDSYSHLGITCTKKITTKANVDEACVKLRGTYFSVICNGIDTLSISAVTTRTIYQTVVIPKALYGCELWNRYTNSDITNLERSHRMCVKNMQGFHRGANTNFSLLCVNMVPIEVYIDYKKLQLLGQLCRLSCNYLAKEVFVQRLVRFRNGDKQSVGFIPDITRVASKYNLLDTIDRYVQSGDFPPKPQWNRQLKREILQRNKHRMLSEVIDSGNEWLYPSVIGVDNCSCLWLVSRETPSLAYICRTLLRVIAMFVSRQYDVQCERCLMTTENRVVHWLCMCPQTDYSELWDSVLYDMGYREYGQFIRLSPLDQCRRILGLAVSNNGIILHKVPIARCISRLGSIKVMNVC